MTTIQINEQRQMWKLHGLIASRAQSDLGIENRLSLLMDLASVPDLDLEALLDASMLDFSHDICGITRHMDRSSYPGKLKDYFVPRYSKTPQNERETHYD